MLALKLFLEEQRRIASDVLLMRGKVEFDLPKSSHAESKINKFNGSIGLAKSQNESKGSFRFGDRPTGCFRCGFNHRVKDCRVPSTIKCRRCQRVGHIENACPEPQPESKSEGPPSGGNASGGNASGGNDNLQTSSSCNSERKSVKLPIEQIKTGNGPCTVLWDTGSEINLVSNEWAEKVGLVGKRCSLDYKVVDSSVKSINSKMYDLNLISRDGITKAVQAYGIPDLAAKRNALSCKSLSNILNSLDDTISISEVDNCDKEVKLLLGSSCIIDFPVIKHKLKDICLMDINNRMGTSKGSRPQQD